MYLIVDELGNRLENINALDDIIKLPVEQIFTTVARKILAAAKNNIKRNVIGWRRPTQRTARKIGFGIPVPR